MTNKTWKTVRNYGLAALVTASMIYQTGCNNTEDKSVKIYDSKTEHVVLKDTDYDGSFDYKVVCAGPKFGQKTMTVYVKEAYKDLFAEKPQGEVIVVPDSTDLRCVEEK